MRQREKDTQKSEQLFVLEDNLGLSDDGVPLCEILSLVGILAGKVNRNEFTTSNSRKLPNNVTLSFFSETLKLQEDSEHKLF